MYQLISESFNCYPGVVLFYEGSMINLKAIEKIMETALFDRFYELDGNNVI